MAYKRIITGFYGPKSTSEHGVNEDDKKALWGVFVDQALRGFAGQRGSRDAPEYWVRVRVYTQHQHRPYQEPLDYWLHLDAERRILIRTDGQKFFFERVPAAQAFTKWYWKGGTMKGRKPFFQDYGITVVRYGVPSADDPEKDERHWWQLTFRDGSVAYLEPTQSLKQARILASLQLSLMTGREVEAGRHKERARFTPKPEAAATKA